ncbi:AAA family ATPase, partial [Candidatus Poribacteria bacterium]|nr:AAA family ATPase [Candidatus Poribacteria bacterium]
MSESPPVLVGIMGGSCSGKTTFARAVTEEIADLNPITLNQDAYFRDWSVYPEDERERLRTANHPDAVHWDALLDHIRLLADREQIVTPPDGTGAAARGRPKESVGPSDVIIVEGHLIYWNESLRDLMTLKLFLDVDTHERVVRRMLRDTGRNGDLEKVVEWYRRDVIPNYPTYTEPCRKYAD